MNDNLRKETGQLLLSSFDKLEQSGLRYYHRFWCPVSFMEVLVREHVVDACDELELMVLRLYVLGIREPEQIASLAGVAPLMVSRALEKERLLYGHIDSKGAVTEMGKRTLASAEQGTRKRHAMYPASHKLQMEAVTGAVIPQELELVPDEMMGYLYDREDGLAPMDGFTKDEEFDREVNARMQLFGQADATEEDTIVIEGMRSTRIYYREAFLAVSLALKYPAIVIGNGKSLMVSVSHADRLVFKNASSEHVKVNVRADEIFERMLYTMEKWQLDSKEL